LIVTRRCNSCKTALHFGRWIAAHTFKLPPSRQASPVGELPTYFLSDWISSLRRGNLIAAARDIFKYLSSYSNVDTAIPDDAHPFPILLLLLMDAAVEFVWLALAVFFPSFLDFKVSIEDARELWIETAYECGHEIPLPATEVEYSGSLSLQIPKSLHLSLAEKAEREGVSLDQYILVVLSKAG
jgi:HicB family